MSPFDTTLVKSQPQRLRKKKAVQCKHGMIPSGWLPDFSCGETVGQILDKSQKLLDEFFREAHT